MPERCAFGDFVIDPAQQRLWRLDGSEVLLGQGPFSALELFVNRAGELLDHETLMRALWPGRVVEPNNLNQVVSSLRKALGDDHDGGRRRYIQTVARRGFRFVARTSPAPTAGNGADIQTAHRPASAATLAVLPFVPLNARSRDLLLEVGMADSLVSRLSTVRGLVVRSVGSVLRFAGLDQDPLRAARQLDAAWVVDGTLQRGGDALRVTARLLDATTGEAAWSGSFDEPLRGVFELQDAISLRVAQVLAQTLAPLRSQRQGALMPHGSIGGTRDADAYQLYLAARQHAQGIRADGLARSLALYREALAIDPAYALALVGVGETYRRMVFGADGAPGDVFEPQRHAISRALALAPELADAHAQLGWIRFWSDFDWPAAEAAFRRALALNANVAGGHFGLGFLLLTLDRTEEGLAHVRIARELDPLSLILNAMEAAFLLGMGRRGEADERLRRVFEIEPNFWVGYMVRSMFDLADDARASAINALRCAAALTDRSTQPMALLGAHLAHTGRRDEANAVLERLRTLQAERYVPPTSIAAVCSALGETGLALDELERAFAARDTRLIYMKDDPRWVSLRGEPRFVALLQRMKLDGYGPGVGGP